ncbi:MAG: ABC transporter permease [Bacillota bacterium]|nr:ABC transporter permease [Bacillota bacterium]
MRILVVTARLIKQITGDKRTLALMMLAPVFIIFLLSTILNSAVTKPKLAVVNMPEQAITALADKAYLTILNSEQEAIDTIIKKESDGYLILDGQELRVVVEGTNPTTGKLTFSVLQQTVMENTLSSLEKLLPQNSMKPADALMLQKEQLGFFYGSENMTMFDSLAPLLMGFFIFFFVFIIAGISFLRERISGTLERTLATPLRRYEIVLGYFLGFGLFVAIQTLVIQLLMIYGLGVVLEGSFWLVLLLNILLAAMALSLGTFLSAFARSEFQLFQFIPIVIVPQILFSGLFDLREAPDWVELLSKAFPLTYGAEALRDVMIRGLGIAEVQNSILILVMYIVAFLILNTIALKKYRRV